MAVKLRLSRMGKKRQPIYKVVAADARSPRDGRIIEAIGLYNPKTEPATVEIKEERALYWLGVGAQPTTTVKNILSKQGILLKKELISKGLSEDKVNAEIEAYVKNQEAKLAASKAKKETKAKKEEPKVEAKEEEKAEESIQEAEGTASAEETKSEG